MSNGYRNGAFALGLVVGGGIALNLFLWLDYQAKRECQNNADNCQTREDSEIGTFWDGLVGTFVSPSDTLAQWVMAFFTIAATGVLVLTLRSANKTNKAAVLASTAALEANQIMRDEQRPWLDIKASPAGDVTFMAEGGTIAIPFDITIENRGRSPAFNVAIEVSLAAVPKGDRVSLGGEDQIALNKRLIDRAVRRAKSGNFTVTVFPDKPHVMNSWNGHAHLLRDGVADGESFGLIYSVVAAYGDRANPEYCSVLPGTILHRTQNGLFAFTLDDIKDGNATIKWADVETARLV